MPQLVLGQKGSIASQKVSPQYKGMFKHPTSYDPVCPSVGRSVGQSDCLAQSNSRAVSYRPMLHEGSKKCSCFNLNSLRQFSFVLLPTLMIIYLYLESWTQTGMDT